MLGSSKQKLGRCYQGALQWWLQYRLGWYAFSLAQKVEQRLIICPVLYRREYLLRLEVDQRITNTLQGIAALQIGHVLYSMYEGSTSGFDAAALYFV